MKRASINNTAGVFLTSWTEHLNPEQQQAVLHNTGPMLILAGAGSGKTTVLVSRTGRLITEGIAHPKKICVLTFTNKAAAELKHRVTAKLGETGRGVWAGTFHSFGLQILKVFHREAHLPKGFGILDSGDSQALVKEILKDLRLADKADFDAGKLLTIMGNWRALHIETDGHDDDPYSVAATWLLPKYLKRLHHLGVVDFEGLLLKPLELFKEFGEVRERVTRAYTQLMVDEFQDTNRTQMHLVSDLVASHKNIVVVGDDDQSIYGWRGACIDNILKFPQAYDDCKVVRLERNYRSTPAILNLANAVIAKNEKRHGKILRSATGSKDLEGHLPELFVYENEDEEVERVVDDIEALSKDEFKFSDIAILFRSNGQGALFEAEFKRRHIPHRVTGGTGFFERKEIKDVLAYIRCALNPTEVALRRIINTPSRGIGETTIDHLTAFALEQKVSLFESVNRWKEAKVAETPGQSLDHLLSKLKEGVPTLLTGTHHPSASLRLLHYMTEIGYKKHIEKHAKDPTQAYQRWRLIEIFGNVLDKFINRGGASPKTLREFIDAMELHDIVDDDEENKNSVQLLTLHACKGLEFPVVYLVGLEEEILPHRTLGSDVSEERRLFYVGVTRAQKKLILSRARERKRFGKLSPCAPSRFLLELPPSCFKEYAMGWRPVSPDQRKSMLAELYKKLDDKKLDGMNTDKS